MAGPSYGSVYTDCLESPEPEQCMARAAAQVTALAPEMALETVLRHGFADELPRQSDRLMLGLYSAVGEPGARIDSPEKQLLDSNAAAALRNSPRSSVLAAMALVAASRFDPSPFDDETFVALATKAKNDPRIPVLALALWVELIGMSGLPADFWVTHVGLPSIWSHAVVRRAQDSLLLADIANYLGFVGVLRPQAQEFLLWYAARPDLTASQKVKTASTLAGRFNIAEQSSALMNGIGDDVEGYDVPAVRFEIAVARLGGGYDARSAQYVGARVLDDPEGVISRYAGAFEDFSLDGLEALESAGAREELRSLGEEALRRAEKAQHAEESGAAAAWYAVASDMYLRAGDRPMAVALAKRGIPYVPDLVRQVSAYFNGLDDRDPAEMARYAQGRGTGPVVALYRAGLVEEAVGTGYLTGQSRYANAHRAGEAKDPQWVIDYGWPLDVEAVARAASRSTDRQFQQSVYSGLVRSCAAPIAECSSEKLRTIAEVAAGMGDVSSMTAALAAATRQIDNEPDSASQALYVAGPWAHCREILTAAD